MSLMEAAAFARVGIADSEPLVTTDPALVRPADAASLVGDASRARTTLGWAPTVEFDEVSAGWSTRTSPRSEARAARAAAGRRTARSG